MFIASPRLLKDYHLSSVANTQTSGDELTPTSYPRATQTTIAQCCQPVEGDRQQRITAKSQTDYKINDKVLDKQAKDHKSTWVDRPEENAWFIHGVHKKYSVMVEDTYNPACKHRRKFLHLLHNINQVSRIGMTARRVS